MNGPDEVGADELGAEVNRQAAIAGVANDEVGPPVPIEIGRDDLRRQAPGGERSEADEAAVAPGIERDGIVAGVHTGEYSALVRIRDPGEIARGEAGVDRDRGFERTGLSRLPLPVENV